MDVHGALHTGDHLSPGLMGGHLAVVTVVARTISGAGSAGRTIAATTGAARPPLAAAIGPPAHRTYADLTMDYDDEDGGKGMK